MSRECRQGKMQIFGFPGSEGTRAHSNVGSVFQDWASRGAGVPCSVPPLETTFPPENTDPDQPGPEGAVWVLRRLYHSRVNKLS